MRFIYLFLVLLSIFVILALVFYASSRKISGTEENKDYDVIEDSEEVRFVDRGASEAIARLSAFLWLQRG